MASTWISVTKELPQTDEEVLVKVERPFSKHAVARYDRSVNAWVQYLCPINDPAIKFAGGWIAFGKDEIVTHWSLINE